MIQKQKSKTYILCKTILYRILGISGNTLLLYLVLGNAKTAGKFAVIAAIFHFILYYVYELAATWYEEKYLYKVKNEA